ncbi:2-isopropylmalate synthase [Paenibacillus flagellatus]|uniref:2-isopropylmalate synthase n=1 Tax=Paenibacillus flagellatus TaxID=2211139 RepID=A0A2V5K138_9BACL|nr:2-isopropylmalate synthase [Paenibacillus flagellatus]PYI52915.1 2-isopropylmalate synthase [Paenibacillus flagellatus]
MTISDRKKIKIFDTTLRDGEQSPGATLQPEQKIVLARQLAKLGVDVLEPGFPISSPGDFAAVQQISRDLHGTGVEIVGFARAMKADIDAAVQATRDAELRRLHIFISSSQILLEHQLRKSREQVIQIAREMVAYGKRFVDRIEFSPMDASRTGEEFLFELVEAVIAEGATVINIPDTLGYALPEEYGRLFKRVREQVRGGDTVEYSTHCHNDLGMAVANSLAAVQAGATQVEVTINGVGERAGNCSLEELVMAIETRKQSLGVETSVNIGHIYETSRMMSRHMHFPIAYNKPIVGRNAFQHESGIHQDGMLKNRSTFEIMDPEQMGIPRNMIILGKHSGRHAIKHRVGELGIELTEQQLEELFVRFKETADEQKRVTDEQLIRLVGSTVNRSLERFTLVDVQVVVSSLKNRVASVTVKDHETGKEAAYSAIAEGSIEALIRCIKQAMPFELEFVDLELQSMAHGEQANAEAAVEIEVGGKLFQGTAIDRDVVVAVARACMAACNQSVREGRASDEAADAASNENVENRESAG